jgi:hypothetical protein
MRARDSRSLAVISGGSLSYDIVESRGPVFNFFFFQNLTV